MGSDSQAVSNGGENELPPRPTPPRPEDCCGSGCVQCIYSIYDDALLAWEREVKRILADARKTA